jgi:hypothetical protein
MSLKNITVILLLGLIFNIEDATAQFGIGHDYQYVKKHTPKGKKVKSDGILMYFNYLEGVKQAYFFNRKRECFKQYLSFTDENVRNDFIMLLDNTWTPRQNDDGGAFWYNTDRFMVPVIAYEAQTDDGTSYFRIELAE